MGAFYLAAARSLSLGRQLDDCHSSSVRPTPYGMSACFSKVFDTLFSPYSVSILDKRT